MILALKVLVAVEFLFTLYIAWRVIKERPANYKPLAVTAILAGIQVFASTASLIDLTGLSPSSLVYVYCEMMLSVGLVCTLLITLFSVHFILNTLKFKNGFSVFAFIVFAILAAFDTAALISNYSHHQMFTLEAVPLIRSAEPFLVLKLVPGEYFVLHQCLVVLMMMLVIFSLLLKCANIPFVFIGKYFFVVFYFVMVSFLHYIYLNIENRLFYFPYSFCLYALLPAVYLWRFSHYKPTIMLSYIRQMVFDRLGSPVVFFDIDDILVDFNIDAEKLFVLEKQLVDHLTLSDFLKRFVSSQIRRKSVSTVEEVTIKTPSGIERVYKLDYSCLNDKFGKPLGTLLIFHDVSELKKLYNTMEKTVMTDVLTGLFSATFLKRKITEINLYRKYPYSAVVCELNGLSLIEEGFGEDSAKAAIMHVAEVLKNQLRSTDFPSYVDGNIVILMPDTDVILAEKVLKRVSDILKKDTTFNFMLSFEYGIASKPTRDSDMQQIVSQAATILAKNKIVRTAYVHDSIIESLQNSLHNSSFETEQHSQRVAKICAEMAKHLKLSPSEREQLELLAMFHDIGKLSVPKEILLKPTALTDEERQVMILHTINGFKIANCSSILSPVARGILCHHENWDGSGYPNGYKGEDIPYYARIVSIADSFDVMTHDRVYAKAVPAEQAKSMILSASGIKFDPKLVRVFDSIPLSKLAKLTQL